jgi:nicotinamidase-related amidase
MTRCLLVIDIQNDYFQGGVLPLWQAELTETRIVAAIHRATACGDKVILIQHVSPASSAMLNAGSPGVNIRPAILAAAGTAPVVVKPFADAFQDTVLQEHLAGTQDLLVCGMMTQNCVAFTALSRAADDLRVCVVGDLCTAPSETVHRIALNALRSKMAVISAQQLWSGAETP